MNLCIFTQCIRCDNYWHLCDELIDDCDDKVEIVMYCQYCGHCQICGCCGNCGKPECENEHI